MLEHGGAIGETLFQWFSVCARLEGMELQKVQNRIFANLFKRSGVTQKQFAEQHGMSVELVNAVLNGRRNAQLEDLQKIARVYGFRVRVVVERTHRIKTITKKIPI